MHLYANFVIGVEITTLRYFLFFCFKIFYVFKMYFDSSEVLLESVPETCVRVRYLGTDRYG